MTKRRYNKLMKLFRELYVQEEKKFNGILNYVYLENNETGEFFAYSPNKETSKKIKTFLIQQSIERKKP
jgi:hypothetical protein